MNKHVLLSLVIATTFLLGTPNDIFAGKNGRLTFKCPKPAHWKLPDGNCIKKGEKRKEGIRRYKNMLGVSNQPKSEKSSQSNSNIHMNSESARENALFKSTQEITLSKITI